MAKKAEKLFVCSSCGYESIKWMGQCICGEWNSMEETFVEAKKPGVSPQGSWGTQKSPIKLNSIVAQKNDRVLTGINEFNRVMGGGIVKDSVTILVAKPGIGKSTLLLQVANDIASRGREVIYASGEESESQIKSRADRLFANPAESLWVLADTSMDNLLLSIDEIDPDVIMVDSIQTFALRDYTARAGTPSQTMECANELLRIAKSTNKPRAVILVGQMNKSDEMAGLRALEHLVDTVLFMEGENEEELRQVIVSKNRFGSTWERGFFKMSEEGMIEIENPSEFFMTKRNSDDLVPGSALSIIKEGSRPIIVEIESLISKTYLPYPLRIVECMKREQLNTLISILEQRGGISLTDRDIVIKITGGIRIKEQAANLAVIMSMVSSLKVKAIQADTIFIADVSLTGELQKVPSMEMRIKEAERMGYKSIYIANSALEKNTFSKGIKIIGLKSLKEVIKSVFA